MLANLEFSLRMAVTSWQVLAVIANISTQAVKNDFPLRTFKVRLIMKLLQVFKKALNSGKR